MPVGWLSPFLPVLWSFKMIPKVSGECHLGQISQCPSLLLSQMWSGRDVLVSKSHSMAVENRQQCLGKLVLRWGGALDPSWPSLELAGVGEVLQHYFLSVRGRSPWLKPA